MAASKHRGPLDPGPDDRETALAARWRRLREGVPRPCTCSRLRRRAGGGPGGPRLGAGQGRPRRHRPGDTGLSAGWPASAPPTSTTPLSTLRGRRHLTITAPGRAGGGVRRLRLAALAGADAGGGRRGRRVAIFLLVTMLVDRERPRSGTWTRRRPPPASRQGTAATIALWGRWPCLQRTGRSAVVRNLFLVLAFAMPLLVASSRLYRGMALPDRRLGGMLLGGLWLLATVHGIRLGVAHGPSATAGRDRRAAVATIGGAPWVAGCGSRWCSTRSPGATPADRRRDTQEALGGPAWRCSGWRPPRRTRARA